MLLKAVSSSLHARRPSKGCPGNLTCISQSVTCQRLHSSNINIKKKPNQNQTPKHKEHLKYCVELYLGHQQVSDTYMCTAAIYCWSYGGNLSRQSRCIGQHGGVISQEESAKTESSGSTACSGVMGKQMITASLVSML